MRRIEGRRGGGEEGRGDREKLGLLLFLAVVNWLPVRGRSLRELCGSAQPRSQASPPLLYMPRAAPPLRASQSPRVSVAPMMCVDLRTSLLVPLAHAHALRE